MTGIGISGGRGVGEGEEAYIVLKAQEEEKNEREKKRASLHRRGPHSLGRASRYGLSSRLTELLSHVTLNA